MRCPHCASPRVDRGACLVCGGLLTTPAAPSPLLDDLETTEEVLGDVRIPNHETPAQAQADDLPQRCAECAAPNPPGRRLCLACGKRL